MQKKGVWGTGHEVCGLAAIFFITMAGKLKVACKKVMKKTFFIILAAAFFGSCNEDLKVNEKKMDKLDQAGKDLQKTVKQGVDTVASKVKKLKNKLEEK
jgi:hypothetical protein